MKREVDDADAQAPRCPSATPFQRSSISTPSSLTVSKSSLSNSSQSIQTPSRRRVSMTSASHHGSSSSSIGSSSRVAAGTTTKKVTKPPRRSRAMSISFRLADFSFMMEGDDEEGGEKDKKDSIPALPQLDIQALQDVRSKAVEKRKQEERKRLAEMRKKKKKSKKEAALASDEKQDKDKKKVKKSKDTPGKKGKSQKEKESHIAKLTKGNLEKFDLQNSYQTRYPLRRGSLVGTETERRRRLSTSFSIDSRNTLSSDLYHTETLSASVEQEVEKLPLVDQAPTESLTFDHMDSDYTSSKASMSHSSYRQISGAILADRVAGRPWETFLKKQGKFYDLHHLQFWQTAQELLTLQDTKQGNETLSSARQLVIQRITALYLLPSGNLSLWSIE
ncbi:hypothetical protein HOLleu_28553 [Holothuria leucospilota]|uniref:Uncharacterized protein n=1 Tax=Holothuria leucospilota TaxID=206669 RepID=A0A9Q1BMD4_HOLLE|nr:hypothetical protein HOLleu_28553 [Holothuria leucospilota]